MNHTVHDLHNSFEWKTNKTQALESHLNGLMNLSKPIFFQINRIGSGGANEEQEEQENITEEQKQEQARRRQNRVSIKI